MKKNARKTLLVPLILLVVLGLAGAYWLWGLFATTATNTRPTNVVLISIDTCRADRLSCYGFGQATTPNIDALAAAGVLFQKAISPAPLTLPSHCSMVTGTRPPHHGVHDNISYRLGPSNVTLAEILSQKGFATGAVVGAFMLDPKFGMAQGFGFYDAKMAKDPATSRLLAERPASEVNRSAKEWIAKHASDPFFLFLHYFDPHYPYAPPPPFNQRFAQNPYAGEIANVDAKIGGIVDELKRLELFDETMIVITSDHGESRGQHGEASHGWFIYHSTTHVPLIIKPAGRIGGRSVKQKVALIDIAPTILDSLGLTIPASMAGQSLKAFYDGSATLPEARSVYTESLLPTRFGCSSIFGLENGRWKYLQSSKPELFDLIADAGEMNNIIGTHPDLAQSMKQQLEELIGERLRTREDEAVLGLDSGSIGRLEDLGYVANEQRGTFEFDSDKEDPKEFVQIYQKLVQAQDLTRRNPGAMTRIPAAGGGWETVQKSVLAKRICEEILSEHPDVSKAHAILGKLAANSKNWEEASFRFGRIVEIAPDFAEAYSDLGTVRRAQGRMDEAADLFRQAIRLASHSEPDSEGNLDRAIVRLGQVLPVLRVALLNLGDVLFAQGKIEEAAAEYKHALELDPRDAKAQYVVGLTHLRNGRRDQATKHLEQALRIKPNYEAARKALRRARAINGQP